MEAYHVDFQMIFEIFIIHKYSITYTYIYLIENYTYGFEQFGFVMNHCAWASELPTAYSWKRLLLNFERICSTIQALLLSHGRTQGHGHHKRCYFTLLKTPKNYSIIT